MTALEIEGVSVARGEKPVVREISMRLEPGRTVALLGPNGAGKSTLVLALAGVLPLTGGSVRLGDTRLDGRAPHQIRRAGIAAVPEGHQVLGRLSVADNIAVAAPRPAERAAALDRAFAVFPELAGLRDRGAGALSGGQQQMLAFAQALVARPKFLITDEMSLGLAPIVVRRLMGVLAQVAAEGTGVLLIEQFTHVALELADDAYVMTRGRISFAGTAAQLKAKPEVLQESYLAKTG
jgi:branched-chain amino acid transport system ATP-binding protein